MSKLYIIGFTGRAGAGKNWAASHIAEHVRGMETCVLAFADPLKDAVQRIFGFDSSVLYGSSNMRETPHGSLVHPIHGPITPRLALTEIGSACRMLHPDVFVENMRRRVEALRRNVIKTGTSCLLLIPDVRHDNEADFVRKQGGAIFHVDTARSAFEKIWDAFTFKHESEQGIAARFVTHRFVRPSRDSSAASYRYECLLRSAAERHLELEPGTLYSGD